MSYVALLAFHLASRLRSHPLQWHKSPLFWGTLCSDFWILLGSPSDYDGSTPGPVWGSGVNSGKRLKRIYFPSLARESLGWLFFFFYYIEIGGILTRQKSAAWLCVCVCVFVCLHTFVAIYTSACTCGVQRRMLSSLPLRQSRMELELLFMLDWMARSSQDHPRPAAFLSVLSNQTSLPVIAACVLTTDPSFSLASPLHLSPRSSW